jgi:hypothetical protein
LKVVRCLCAFSCTPFNEGRTNFCTTLRGSAYETTEAAAALELAGSIRTTLNNDEEGGT